MTTPGSPVPPTTGTQGGTRHVSRPVEQPTLAKPQRSTWRGHLDLLDPVTWPAGPQGFISGAIASAGMAWDGRTLLLIVLGSILCGPLTIGFSQSINDFFDQDVDAVNEPTRPIPAGLVTPRGAILNFTVVAILAILVSLIMAQMAHGSNGWYVIFMTIAGLALGTFYSSPPFPFKRNGLWGPVSVGLGYNLLTWICGNMLFAPLKIEVVVLALVNAAIAIGLIIMNDLKSIDGDRALGLRTVAVQYGAHGALIIAFALIDLSQIALAVFLFAKGEGYIWLGLFQVIGLIVQIAGQPALYRKPDRDQYKRYLLIGNGFVIVAGFLPALAFGGIWPFIGWN
jgi:bacteriochlorophyll/chlorophyll synthetase